MEYIEELHDSGIQKICIDFEKQAISMAVSIFSDKDKDYYSILLEFYTVKNIEIKEIELDTLEELVIYDFSNKENNGKNDIEFIISLGTGKPSSSIKFTCESLVRSVV